MRAFAVAGLVLFLGATSLAEARPLDAAAPVIDRAEEDCTQIPPDQVPPLALDRSKILPLNVRLMIERPHATLARGYMAKTRVAFERIGIKMRLRTDFVRVPAEWKRITSAFDEPSPDELFAFMKERYGGKRPKRTDLVYYMTPYWSGGIADCIGGIRFDDRAFALGSLDYALERTVPAPHVNEGVIAAHELGHLLGAHHHYSNCSEAQPFAALAGDVGPCTTMSPLATTATSIFGTLETTYIRYYAAEYHVKKRP